MLQVVTALRQDRLRFLQMRHDGILLSTSHACFSCFAVFTDAVVAFSMVLLSSPAANAPAPVAYPPNSSYIQSISDSEFSDADGSVGPEEETNSSLLRLGIEDGLVTTADGQQVYKLSVRPRAVCRLQSRSQFRKRLLRQDYSRGPHALISGISKVEIPPAVKILYQDWESHYRNDPHFSGVLPEVISANVGMGLFGPWATFGRTGALLCR